MKQHKANADSCRLSAIPGVGPMSAISFALQVDATQFRSGRHFAAWLGLVPREHSTAGKQRLGAISRAGNERFAPDCSCSAPPRSSALPNQGRSNVSPWLLALLERRPRKLAAVALANKMARIVWAMLRSGESYRPHPAATG
jgi:transposase